MNGAAPQPACAANSGVLRPGRAPLAHLLHALNQPLTGLQCSLELAAAGPRSTEQYRKTLLDGLELTARMRNLVEAMTEIAELQQLSGEKEKVPLGDILSDTVEDLLPVAQAKAVYLSLEKRGSLLVPGSRRVITGLAFRLLESALSGTRGGGVLRIIARQDEQKTCLNIVWEQERLADPCPGSLSELGLLVAQAGWEHVGAEWTLASEGLQQRCVICLPLASS